MDSLMNALGFYRVETKGTGMNYNDYLAAVERLRQLDLTDNDDKCKLIYGSTCYLPTNQAVRADKVFVYDAEHDREPASVEWMREVLGEPTAKFGHITIWRITASVEFRSEGSLIRFMANIVSEMYRNPTRGEVLTALRLFKKEGA